MDKMRKLILLVITAMLLTACGSGKEEKEGDTKEIEVQEKFTLNGAEIIIHDIEIKDKKAKMTGMWNNKNNVEGHANYFAPMDIMQGDELLEYDDSNFNKKVDSGVNGSLRTTFELDNLEDDIELKFFSNDNPNEKEVITIEIK